MYHFSGPSASMKPPDEFELSEPRRCLPRRIGVEAPGGDRDMLCGPSGVLTPGERDRGCAWRWCDDVAALTAAAAAADNEVVTLTEGVVSIPVAEVEDGVVALVVIDRGFEGVAFVVVVETCALAAKLVGEVTGDCELDDALYVGFE